MFILKIKELREKRRLSQNKLAYKAYVTQSYISYLEHNPRDKSPTLRTLEDIAMALDVCPLELLECTCKKCRK